MPDFDFKTAILRFRDLATPPGGTIERHDEEIADHGATWWGWWNKAGERVPQEAFTELSRKIGAENEKIYLFDSGQEKLYEAACNAIEWDDPDDQMTSPDSSMTPDYYADERECLAWFRFTRIDPIDDIGGRLQDFSYYQVDDLFQENSKFEPFYGKRVISTEELRFQERTVWFVRCYESGDPAHELLTPNTDQMRPQHFVDDFRTLNGKSLLWVSDVHFSSEHHSFPVYADDATPERVTLADRIIKDILPKYDVGGLIFSGDFTWKASYDEFVAAKSFIENLELQIASRSRQVVICPGNHDLKWSDEPEVKDNKVTTVSGDAREEYNRFYRQLFYQDANEFMTMGRRLLLGQAHPIEIASLNSSHLQQEKGHFQGHGFTGEDQRRQVEEEMNWKSRNKHPRTTRILVVHHDVLPTSFTERLQKEAPYSLMLDAEGLLQWATKNRIDIILHGHKHQPSYNVIQRPLRNGEMHTVHVLAAGSAGVKSGHLAEINRNTVTVLTFENESVHCETYPVRPSASTEDPIERHTHTLSLSAS